MDWRIPPISIGSVIAIIVLVIAIVLMVIDEPLEPVQVFGLIAALAVARLT